MDYSEAAIYLSGCAVNGTVPEKSRLEGLDLAGVYQYSQAHMISAIVGYALEKAGIKNELFTQARAKALRKAVILDADCRNISGKLEEAGIWHMPLKGSVMKDYYPAFGLREMSDVDIFFNPSYVFKVRKIMKELGFKTGDFFYCCHDTYYREPVSNIEMHSGIMGISRNNALNEYFYNAKDKMILDDGKMYTYHLGPEDFYIYITAHTYRHYTLGGIGLRSLIDEYVYMRKFSDSMDWGYISREFGKMEITEFEENLRTLAMSLFGGGELNASNREMLEYIKNSKAFGHLETNLENAIEKSYRGSKRRYVIGQIFPPFSTVKYLNPLVWKHKYLYPFFVINRLWTAGAKHRKYTIAKIKHLFRR